MTFYLVGGLIGGVVVAVIVIIALVVAIFFFLRRRREKGSNDVEQVEMKQKKRQKSIRHNMVTPPIRGQYFYFCENGHFVVKNGQKNLIYGYS